MAKIVASDYTLDLVAPQLETMTEEEFFHFCLQNKHIHIERDENQQILFMPPEGIQTSATNSTINGYLTIWNMSKQSGVVFGTSAGFTLPDGSMRSPDAAWMTNEKYHALSEEEKQRFAHVVPDFIVELASPSDNLKLAREKMEMWRRNGVRLAWLIIPQQEKAIIYRQDGSTVELNGFAENTLHGEDVLPGFELKLNALLPG
jgi:Uma2 family endonuclease